MHKVYLESFKELMRVVLLSIIPVAIYQIERYEFDFKTLYVVGGIAFLRALDKLLHEAGNAKDDERLKHGLTGF